MTFPAVASTRPVTCLTNAYLVLPDGNLTSTPASIWVDASVGKIVAVSGEGAHLGEHINDCNVIDLEGAIVGPGLIDIQINGAFGVDFSKWENDEDTYRRSVDKVAKGLLQTGVTSFVPTIISQTPATYPALLPLLDPTSSRSVTAHASSSAANVLGYHLEGPFLSDDKPGCHPQENLRSAPLGFASFEEVYGSAACQREHGCVKLVTLAPELEGVGVSVSELAKRGWTVSLGHSAASTSQSYDAVVSGATLITHLFNAMPQLHHREPGIIGLLGMPAHAPASPSAFHMARNVQSTVSTPLRRSPSRKMQPDGLSSHDRAIEAAIKQTESHKQQLDAAQPAQFGDSLSEPGVERPYWGIITDGIHCHPQAVNFAYKAHPEGCVLVTDAVQLMDPNLADGVYPWRDGTSINKSGARITLEGTDTLAGSAVTLDECVRNLSTFASIPLSQSILCASTNAAKSLGEAVASRKGTLAVGFDADLSVWDRQTGQVKAAWLAGKLAYSA